MRTAPKRDRGLATRVALVNSAAALHAIGHPDIAAAIWDRTMPSDVRDWLDALDPEHLPRGRVTLPAHRVEEIFWHLCEIAQTPSGPECAWLARDIAELAEVFATHMSAQHLKLRLDVLQTEAGDEFQIGAFTARLICTYCGLGTQYGTPSDGEDSESVATVPTGAPIVLTGALWPQVPPSGLLHRRPAAEGTGSAHLVLVLDPIVAPEARALRQELH